MSTVQPLSTLSQNSLNDAVLVTDRKPWGGLGSFIFWFVIIAVIAWLVLYSVKPAWVLRPGTTEVDSGKVLWISILIALVIVIIIWLFRSMSSGAGVRFL